MVIKTAVSESNSDNKMGVIIQCETENDDLSAIAGGAMVSDTSGNVVIVDTRPDGVAGEVPKGWRASAVEAGGGVSGNWTLTVYAVCASVN